MFAILPLITLTIALQAPAISPQSYAKNVWDSMISASSKATSMSLESIMTEKEAADSSTEKPSVKSTLKFKRPSSFRLEETDLSGVNKKSITIVSNGKKLYLPFGEKIYGRDAPSELAGSLRYFDRNIPDAGLHLLIYLGSSRDLEKFFKNISSIKFAPKQEFEGKVIDIISGAYKNSKGADGYVEIGIGTDDHLLYKLTVRLNATVLEGGVTPTKEAYIYDWKFKYAFNQKFDESTFAAPDGAVE